MREYELDAGRYNEQFEAGDYTHLMGQNMVLIISVLVALLLLWSSIIMKDIINRFICPRAQKERRWYARKHTAWCHNFILRYLYEFFLEFCICVFLQLSIRDYSDVSPRL